MSEMKEKGTPKVPVEITEAELNEVVGGARLVHRSDEEILITWEQFEQMNSIWDFLNQNAAVIKSFGVNIYELKEIIRGVAKESIGLNLRYYAFAAGGVILRRGGIIC